MSVFNVFELVTLLTRMLTAQRSAQRYFPWHLISQEKADLSHKQIR